MDSIMRLPDSRPFNVSIATHPDGDIYYHVAPGAILFNGHLVPLEGIDGVGDADIYLNAYRKEYHKYEWKSKPDRWDDIQYQEADYIFFLGHQMTVGAQMRNKDVAHESTRFDITCGLEEIEKGIVTPYHDWVYQNNEDKRWANVFVAISQRIIQLRNGALTQFNTTALCVGLPGYQQPDTQIITTYSPRKAGRIEERKADRPLPVPQSREAPTKRNNNGGNRCEWCEEHDIDLSGMQKHEEQLINDITKNLKEIAEIRGMSEELKSYFENVDDILK